MFYSDRPAETSREFFVRYAEEQYAAKIPFTWPSMRSSCCGCHIWLYAEFQVIFITAVTEAGRGHLVRTILMLDLRHHLHEPALPGVIRGELNERLACST
jgi:hypothetical protein